MKKNKVAIVGFASSWKQAPFESNDFEIWTLNEAYNLFKQVPNARADRWFEIHNPNSPSKNTPEHHAFLKELDIPLYMWKKYDEFPSSLPFPKDEIMEWMTGKGFLGYRYFTNSISWMIAAAAYMGFKEIHIYGVDLATSSEYSHQRPSAEYIIGICEGLGIKLHIPADSDLLKTAQLYGFESDNGMRLKMKQRIKELSDRQKGYEQEIAKIDQQIKQLENVKHQHLNAIHQIVGGKEVVKNLIANWMV